MPKEVFTKIFRGERSEKRYQNEVDAFNLFPHLVPAIISANDQLMEISFERITGDSHECSPETLTAIGETLATVHRNHHRASEWKRSHLTERYRAFRDKDLAALFEQVSSAIKQPVYGLTHGDYRRRNILSTPEGIKVVDWEFFGTNFVYWDLAIFSGDYVHQKFHGAQTNSLQPFWEGYLSQIELTDEEIALCKTLGALDIIADHVLVQPAEKPPEPEELFVDFSDQEKEYLLDHRNYD